MKARAFALAILTLATLVVIWSGPAFAQVEKAVVKIEGGMQCSL